MFTPITKNIIYPALSHLRKENIYDHLNDLEKTQWLKSDELKNKQWSDLQALLYVVYARNSYYRDRFKDAGLMPHHIQNHDDFLKVPILEKNELRKNAKQLITQGTSEIIESRKTSGSTGIPLEIFKPRDAFGRIRAVFHRYYKWHGIEIGDKQARFFGHPVTFKARLKEDMQDILLNKYRLDPVFLTEKNMLKFYNTLKRAKIKYFYGYASAIYEFGKFLEKRLIDAGGLLLKAIITTGETLYGFQKELIESVFKTRVVNEYGCSETGIIAFECEHNRMHLSTDNLFIEILKDNKPAALGETGSIVVTELFNYAAPLIRYRIGDMAKVSERMQCECKRALPCVDSIEGRTSQFIDLANGRKVHTELFHYISDALAGTNGAIEQFQVIQDKNLEFKVEYVSEKKDQDQSLKYMLTQFKKFLGNEAKINFCKVNAIGRDKSGKLRYFIKENA